LTSKVGQTELVSVRDWIQATAIIIRSVCHTSDLWIPGKWFNISKFVPPYPCIHTHRQHYELWSAYTSSASWTKNSSEFLSVHLLLHYHTISHVVKSPS